MAELIHETVTDLAKLIRRHEVSPVELMRSLLGHIESTNPRLNAIVTLNPDALEQARAAEAAVARGGEMGPLYGVPLTVKDTISTADLRTTSGSKRRAVHIPSEDAVVVARLKAAGAVILGKTNTSELAMAYDADNPLFGRTNNPHDLTRTSGGSSGGEAAAIASFMSSGGIGSDLMGSLRVPAHFCGIASLKPTTGVVPMTGHTPEAVGPYSLGAAIGPMARTVADLELLFSVIVDPTLPCSLSAPVARRVSRDELRGLQVAVYADDECSPVTAETIAAVQNAALTLKDAGMEIVEELPPGISRGPGLWTELFSRGGVSQLRRLYAGHEDEAGGIVRAILRKAETAEQSLDDYLDAWVERDRLRAELLEFMETVPLLLCPVGSAPAFTHGARTVEVKGRSLSIFESFSYCQTFNVYGLPVACVTAGRSAEGLPIGVQIVGRPYAEAQVLAAASTIEAAGSWCL
ncbi:MAG: amidase [Pyrinomonadaceae bacterium]